RGVSRAAVGGRARLRHPAPGDRPTDCDAAAGEATALADDGAACVGAVARHRVAVRPRRCVTAEAADDTGRTAGGGRADLPAEPGTGRRAERLAVARSRQ